MCNVDRLLTADNIVERCEFTMIQPLDGEDNMTPGIRTMPSNTCEAYFLSLSLQEYQGTDSHPSEQNSVHILTVIADCAKQLTTVP